MAQVTTVELVDDIEGGPADETLELALDGKAYELDLSAKNAEKLRDILHPYVSAARRAGGRSGRSSSTPRPATSTTDREKNQEVREGLRKLGYPVKDRGRIPQDWIEGYRAGTAYKPE